MGRSGRDHGLRRRVPGAARKRYLDWNLQDPAGMPIEVVRQIRDRIAGLVAELD
jgi:hypothetical protein